MEKKEIHQAELDCAKQEIHNLKREVSRLTLLEKDYLSELEGIQQDHTKKQKELQVKIHDLEDANRTVVQSKIKSIEQLEQELALKCDEIKLIREELESASRSKPAIDNTAELQMLACKIQELEDDNKILSEENLKIKDYIDDLEKGAQCYEEMINKLRQENNSLTETYHCKLEDLNEAKELVEKLQDELMVTKTELETIKSKPVESSTQGNSLFAEVDDKRLQLQKKVKMMTSHYEQMKRQTSLLEDQISNLLVENGVLKQKLEKEIEERADDRYDVREGYMERIHSLESLINDYKKELESRPLVSTKCMKQEELAFIEYRIKLKNEEIQKLLEKIDKNSLSNLILMEQSRESAKEATGWQLKYMNTKDDLEKKDAVIAKLEEKIREMEIANVQSNNSVGETAPSPKPDVISPNVCRISEVYIDVSRLKKRSCSVVKEGKGTEIGQSQKENKHPLIKSISKKVQFAKETKENESGDRSFRRGGKTIICQPMVLKKKDF